LGWLLASLAVAAVGAYFKPGPWYVDLVKPVWTPPNSAFPIVWNLLFVMMALAAWLVWRDCGFRLACRSLGLYGIQLVLNAAWSWLFFGLHRPGLALAEILALWLTILVVTVLFWRRRAAAGLLMVPYLVWVGFAAFLNHAIWRLNT